MLRFLLCSLLLLPSFCLADADLIGISAKIILPTAEKSDLANLAVTLEPLPPSTDPTDLINYREISGGIALEIPALGKLWIVEVRHSAQLLIGANSENNIQFDLEPIEVESTSEKVLMSDVKLVYATDDNVICSADMFGPSFIAVGTKAEQATCSIDQVISL